LLAESRGNLSLGQIAEVIVSRFDLGPVRVAELEENLQAEPPDVVVQVERNELASSVLSRLGLRGVQVLREFEKGNGNIEGAANALDLTPSEVAEEVSRVMRMIAEFADTIEEARAVYQLLIESLF